jgi:hypothetical protein
LFQFVNLSAQKHNRQSCEATAYENIRQPFSMLVISEFCNRVRVGSSAQIERGNYIIWACETAWKLALKIYEQS